MIVFRFGDPGTFIGDEAARNTAAVAHTRFERGR